MHEVDVLQVWIITELHTFQFERMMFGTRKSINPLVQTGLELEDAVADSICTES